jgi:hypothetical protein
MVHADDDGPTMTTFVWPPQQLAPEESRSNGPVLLVCGRPAAREKP